jgi:hypothetical protein
VAKTSRPRLVTPANAPFPHRGHRANLCIDTRAPALPHPRGLLSHYVLDCFDGRAGAAPRVVTAGDALDDDDLQLALYLCYELHYRSFAGVPDEIEWCPTLLAFRSQLECAFLARLLDECEPSSSASVDVESEVARLVEAASGPAVSSFMSEHGSLAQMREFAMHRSAYQRKEADPHTWAIPRLDGEAKAALVRIQADEYGQGVRRAMHLELFAQTMLALDLDPTYGAYLDVLPGTTLATVNIISLFGLHRRWRGALLGHLTVYEMTSVTPMGRYCSALERLGVAREGSDFYRAHVVADAEHQVVALHDMAGGLARSEPDLGRDIVFGACATLLVEARFGARLLDAWSAGLSSLRPPIAPAA